MVTCGDGWFRPAYLGVLEADGYLRIVDRKKDMMIRGGSNVYPRERMAGYKYPRLVVLTDALPLGPSGKVLKRELTRRYTAVESAA